MSATTARPTWDNQRIKQDRIRLLQAEMKRAGVSLLLSEQNLAFARRVADRGYMLEQGQIRQAGTLEQLELLI